jgi:hypothetical protein
MKWWDNVKIGDIKKFKIKLCNSSNIRIAKSRIYDIAFATFQQIIYPVE